MSIDYHGFRYPKPEKRVTTKRRSERVESDRTQKTRAYIFARERNICRCCRLRAAESMHEIVFRSRGGRVTRWNSIAVCGDGVRGCHGFLQRHRITVAEPTLERAEGRLIFEPKDERAAEWLKIGLGAVIVSDLMVAIEALT